MFKKRGNIEVWLLLAVSCLAVWPTELDSAERVHLYFSRTENIVAEGKQIQITRRIWHRSKGGAALNTEGRGGDHQTQVTTWLTRFGDGGAKKHSGTTGFSLNQSLIPTLAVHTPNTFVVFCGKTNSRISAPPCCHHTEDDLKQTKSIKQTVKLIQVVAACGTEVLLLAPNEMGAGTLEIAINLKRPSCKFSRLITNTCGETESKKLLMRTS